MRESIEDFPDYECRRHGKVEPKVSRTAKGYLHRRCPLCLKETFDKAEWQRQYRAGRERQAERLYLKVAPGDPYHCKIHGVVEPLVMKRSTKKGFLRLCGACKRERSRVYSKRYRDGCVKRVLKEYGARCWCCAQSEPLFLTIDHIDRNGWRERAESRTDIYIKLVAAGFPKDNYRLACYNCNAGRERNGGVCPHEMKGGA
jgi:hypothetical protein